MPPTKKTQDSPLLSALRDQVVPWVGQRGIENLIVARPTWKAMQAADQTLPGGVYLTRETFKSRRVRARNKSNTAQVNGQWPEEALYSRRAPVLGFVIKGAVAVPFGNYKLHCKSGHSFLVLPGTPHSDGTHLLLDDDFLHDGTREIFYLMTRGNGVECWLSRVRDHLRLRRVHPGESYYVPNPLASQYLDSLTEEMTQQRSHFVSMSNALMVALVTLLLREIQETRFIEPGVSQRIIPDSQVPALRNKNPMACAEDYIQTHLREDLTIDKVAGHLYMSRSYFTREFRAHTGKTFVEYLTQCRLEEAKVLLHDTAWSIYKISEVLGLKPSHFRVIFRASTGISPSEFRQKSRQDGVPLENLPKNIYE